MDNDMGSSGYNQGFSDREGQDKDSLTQDNDLIAASRVKGTAVYDSEGSRIGTVDDLMIGKMDGEVAFAIMSFGGFLGIGERYHPLPWDSLDYDTDLGGYRVGAIGDSFRDAPNYSRDQFEDDDDDWRTSTSTYYDDAAQRGQISRRGSGRSSTYGGESQGGTGQGGMGQGAMGYGSVGQGGSNQGGMGQGGTSTGSTSTLGNATGNSMGGGAGVQGETGQRGYGDSMATRSDYSGSNFGRDQQRSVTDDAGTGAITDSDDTSTSRDRY